ncbi:MAG: ribosome-associated translation inhibitor RaiA [Patescibacteria group bacterium]
MEIKIKTTGSVVMTDELRAFIEKKLEKVSIFVRKDDAAIVEVEVGTTSAGQRTGDVYRAEAHITFSGGDVYADAITNTLHGAIDRAVSEARRELKKKKGKDRDMVRKGASEVKKFFRTFGK